MQYGQHGWNMEGNTCETYRNQSPTGRHTFLTASACEAYFIFTTAILKNKLLRQLCQPPCTVSISVLIYGTGEYVVQR